MVPSSVPDAGGHGPSQRAALREAVALAGSRGCRAAGAPQQQAGERSLARPRGRGGFAGRYQGGPAPGKRSVPRAAVRGLARSRCWPQQAAAHLLPNSELPRPIKFLTKRATLAQKT